MRDSKTSEALLDPENTACPDVSRPKKVGFVSLGCPKNLVDSEVMMGMLEPN
jgi:ribosomal protein S12 methylthiotransferase